MRLHELQKPNEINLFKQQHDPNDSSLKNWRLKLPEYMKKFGFEPLGSGTFGSVYGKTSYPFALKVFRSDFNYISWIEFCRNNPDNPFCIKSKGSPVRIIDDIFAIRIEKLTTYNKASYFADAIESRILGNIMSPTIVKYMDKTLPGWEKDNNLKKIIKFLKFFGDDVDIHFENVMLRGRQPVIVDPLSSFG